MENTNNLELNHVAIEALRESAKWTLFLSILGFIGIGFMVIASVFVGTLLATLPDVDYGTSFPVKSFLPIIYLLMALVYVFPVYYLYKYASGMKKALDYRNSNEFANALVFLKSHHKFLGITAIVMISMYILIILIAIVGGLFAATSGY